MERDVASKNISKNYLVLNGDTIFKADIREIYGQFINKKIKNPLIILKKSQNIERFGGYKKIDKGWLFTNERTNFISLGMFFINFSKRG